MICDLLEHTAEDEHFYLNLQYIYNKIFRHFGAAGITFEHNTDIGPPLSQ